MKSILCVIAALSWLSIGAAFLPAQETNQAASTPAEQLAATSAKPSFDAQKIAPSLALTEPWIPLTPSAFAKLQMFYMTMMPQHGFVKNSQFTSGYTYGKPVKFNYFKSELIETSVSQEVLSPELFVGSYQRGVHAAQRNFEALDGFVSNLIIDPPTWSANLHCVVCPLSWKTPDGTTSHARGYVLPTTGYTLAFMVLGGSQNSDKVFADFEQALAKVSIPADLAEPATWGDQAMALLQKH